MDGLESETTNLLDARGGDETDALPAIAATLRPDADTLASDLKWALTELSARSSLYTVYRDYYEGRHPLHFATEKWRNTYGGLFRRFFDNISKIVVTTAVDRLEIIGFETAGGDENAAEAILAQTIWDASNLDLRAKQTHREALREGDAYIIVWPDAQTGLPRITPQKAHLCCVRYAAENLDTVELGAKWFVGDDGRGRVNLYYPSGIAKFTTRNKLKSGGLPANPQAYAPLADGADWVPNPWGVVPMFHFANDADAGDYGTSELADVIPLQDALNKAVLDMMVGGEYVSLPQRYATGIEVETRFDIERQEEVPVAPFKPGVDSLWVTGNEQANFGQFPAADFAQLLAVQEKYRTEIARLSRTPLHFIALEGDWPSGEALKTAEGPFVSKVSDRQLQFGAVWQDALRLALLMAGMRTAVGALKPRWTPAETRIASLFAQEITAKAAVGVPEEQLWREYGYTEEEIEQFRELKAEAAAQAVAAFQAGRIAGLPGGPGSADDTTTTTTQDTGGDGTTTAAA